uniref:Ig-like domain-containing protein n=1 Tax=Fundulus heteroclitus TaxID=8078 RepID=A0A3Q2QHY9_FUNHE
MASVSYLLTPAEPGQDVTLPCRTADNQPAVVVDWSRTDLGEDFVLLFRDNKLDSEGQHPSFRNRVGLWDEGMKDGDVSLVLKNVKAADRGTYECRVAQRGNGRNKRAVLIICSGHHFVFPSLVLHSLDLL